MGKKLEFEPTYTNDVCCYKNEKAFEEQKGICYIAECDCQEYFDVKKGVVIIDTDDLPKLIKQGGVSTYESIIAEIVNLLNCHIFDDEHIFNEKEDMGFVVKLAKCGFDIIEWECFSTWLFDVDLDEEWEYYKQEIQEKS